MLELIIRLVASLAVVVGLMLLLARFMGKRYGGRAGAPVQVLHRQPLSRSSSVAVITVGSRVLVVGTTDHQVSLLTELDPDELELTTVALETEDVALEDDAIQVPLANSRKPVGSGAGAQAGPLNGSLLSPQTWRQALAAAKDRAS
ncbi:hypothetical protein EXE58_07040 [Nocardioides seonyuensis]|uniref:Flagellar protein n=1 Tax=Nocardioides seonyuensis TaxID=2518371 RepID=A0A4P7IDI7_9ACTN|nr:flagellar biosynthetic protein FliO [Nocardioides seonyuensis]QBX55229.1 hypothetical protein EXE58_07040 [Nocardioides seonyuensis]